MEQSAITPPPTPPPWSTWTAALVPLAAFVLSASGYSYWLDSGEFTAAAVYLDIAHPPGQPLTSLWSKLFTLLPVGPVPFRVALSQAAAGALALAFAQRAISRSIVFCGFPPGHFAGLLALGATWGAGGAYGYWFNSNRPEVYALQALCVCIALERLVTLAVTRGENDPRPLYVASLALGLGLANHHFLSVLAMPALAMALVRLTRAAGLRVLGLATASGTVGLLGYVYLPLRAHTRPPMDLGHPVTPQSLAWVVSARVYARGAGTQATEPLGDRFADLFALLLESFGSLVVTACMLGLYLLARRRRTRELGFVWGVPVIVGLCGRAWLGGHIRGNPDALGYMMPGFIALLALAACGLALVATELTARGARVLMPLAALAVVASGAAQLVTNHAQASLAGFHATDDFDEPRRRALPEGAVLVLTTPESVFRYWGGEASEVLRPDVTMLPVPFLDYGETGRVLAERHPELRTVVARYLRDAQLDLGALRELAHARPVLLEADTRVAPSILPHTLPSGLFYSLPPHDPAVASRAAGERTQTAAYAALYGALTAQAGEAETKKKLLWMHYVDALYYAMMGMNDAARASCERGLALEPAVRELQGMLGALSRSGGRPVDVRPFVVGP